MKHRLDILSLRLLITPFDHAGYCFIVPNTILQLALMETFQRIEDGMPNINERRKIDIRRVIVTTGAISFLMIVFSAYIYAQESSVTGSGPANKFFTEKNFRGAVDFLEEYIARGGDDPDAKMQLAIAYIYTGRHTEAVGLLQSIIADEPENAFAYIWCARARAELGMNDEAGKLIAEGTALDPENEKLITFAGEVAYETGDYETAEKYAYRFSGPDASGPPTDGDSFMLLFFSTIKLDGLETAYKMFEDEDYWSVSLNYCLRQRAADVFIGHIEDNMDMADSLLAKTETQCDKCGIVSFKRGYAAELQGDYRAAAGYYADAAGKACLDDAFDRGGGYADLLRINALRKSGTANEKIIELLDAVRDLYSGLPYFQWLYAIAMYVSEDNDSAVDYYLRAEAQLPANFLSEPGPYTILTKEDYSILDDISIIAEDDMEYLEIGCDRDLDMPVGMFFTTLNEPGLSNLFRYIGPADKDGMCKVVVYSADSEKIVKKVEALDIRLTPIRILEDAYFLESVYPSYYISQDYWYVPVYSIFPFLSAGDSR